MEMSPYRNVEEDKKYLADRGLSKPLINRGFGKFLRYWRINRDTGEFECAFNTKYDTDNPKEMNILWNVAGASILIEETLEKQGYKLKSMKEFGKRVNEGYVEFWEMCFELPNTEVL